jgi:hypothetical protein
MCDASHAAASEATKDIVRTVHVTRGDTPTQLEDAQARHLPFFQTTHVYDEKFPIPTILVCMRAKKIPKGRTGGAARRRGEPPPLVHSNKERLGAKRGLFCARRCSGMCATALLLYPPRPA